MDKAAIMTNRWISSEISVDQELPEILDAPFSSPKKGNDNAANAKHESSDINEKARSADIEMNSSVGECKKLINETSSLVSPMRINHRVQIDVINIEEDKSNAKKHILIYEEQYTKFVILKALTSNDPCEVANELSDIVATIGAPRIIQSGNGRDYAEQVVREIRLSLRDFCVVHGDSTKNGEKRRDFESILKSWMNNNPGRSLNDALRIVQVMENTAVNSRNGKAPGQLFFGSNICEDLRRTIGTKGSKGNVFSETLAPPKRDNSLRDETEKTLSKGASNGVSSKLIAEARNLANEENKSPIDVVSVGKINSDEEKVSKVAGKSFKCKMCEKAYAKLGHLTNHMKTHAKTCNYECAMCRKSFESSSLRDRHTRCYHEKEKKENNEEENNEDRDKSIDQKNEKNANEAEKKTYSTNERAKRISTKRKNETKMSLRSLDKRSLKTVESWSEQSKNSIRTKINDDNLLECTYCEQKFNFPSVLKRHMRCHTNERPYACELCNKTFKQLGHLSQHSLTHTDYRSFRCTVCSIKFDTLDSLKLHSRSSHDDQTAINRSKEAYRLFECDICRKVFTTKSVLERHIFTHTHERKFSCKICNKRFKQASHVKSHMLVHTGERKFACDLCPKRFSLSNSLKKHMYVHNGEKPHQCDICGSRFLEKRNLNSHLMTHTNEKPFSCKICGKRYTLVDTLRRHVSAAHEDGRIYQCEICAKMFKQLAHLSVHKKVHTDERPFQCHLCEKNFKHKNVLKSHLAIHANVRAFECDICKATFVRKTNLQTHIASAHMNERPYHCSICDKRFKQISHLNGHIIVHSNSMPYQCDYCDRRCNRLDNLKKHMRLHAKNKG